MLNQNDFPTKGNLIHTQHTLKLAQQGYMLLDQKKNVLIQELSEAKKQIKLLQAQMEEMTKTAKAALRYANIELGSSRVKAIADSITPNSAVKTESTDKIDMQVHTSPPYSLAETSPALDEAYQSFSKVKGMVITLATAESKAQILEADIRKTGKRANALLYIIIPKCENRMRLIQNALEEKDRDSFVRLKLSKNSGTTKL